MNTLVRTTPVLAALALCLAAALPAAAAVQDTTAAAQEEQTTVDRYPLTVCPVSGGKLGAMGAPHVVEIEGREVRFCCPMCVAKFKADTAGYFAKMDSMIIAELTPDYPLDVCLVSGDELGDEGEPVDYVQDNRLYRLCCANCVKSVKADPEGYSAKLDQAYDTQAAEEGATSEAHESGTMQHEADH